MEILIGIVIVLGGGAMALYIWSSGGLFGRILIFLILAPVLSLIIGAYFCPIDEAILHNPGGQIGFLAGLFLAWIAAGIPRYVRRADVFMARRAHSRRERALAAAYSAPPRASRLFGRGTPT